MNLAKKNADIINLNSKRKKREQAAWALSYGDMVTALLCFFIIFYALEKQFERNKVNPVKGYTQTDGILLEHKTSHKTGYADVDFQYAMDALEQIPDIEVHRTSSFVDIFFKKTIFFDKGKTKLTRDGKIAIDEVISRFTKIQGKYILEVQGHADNTPVKSMDSRWWKSNMELSVLRALTVHTYLADIYIEKSNLIVSGHGDLKKLNETPEESADINRRISLRLQLVK